MYIWHIISLLTSVSFSLEEKTHNSKVFPWKPAWSRSWKIQAFHQEEQECNINQAAFLKHNDKDNESMAVYAMCIPTVCDQVNKL